jgi:hypothetical protein
MGLFDFFSPSEEAQLKKHAKRMKNLNAQPEERQMSAHWLAENGSDAAVIGLLARFGINYEQRMKDAHEKDFVFQLLVDIGEKACPSIRAWAMKNPSFAYPLQVIEKVQGGEAATDLLLDMLGREVDPFKPEKKRQILIKLADYHDVRIVERVPACLQDFDEGIRYAAAEALLAQETDQVRSDLARALANREEDSNRLRVRIAEAFQKRNWSLGEFASDVQERPPVGWAVQGENLLPV